MRVVLDTNVLISALHFGGRPRRVLEAALRGEHQLVIGTAILSELESVLVGMCGWTPDRATAACRELEALGELVLPAEVPHLCRDPDDKEILAIAAAGQVAALVTGDADLLALASYGRVRILTVADFEETDILTSAPDTP